MSAPIVNKSSAYPYDITDLLPRAQRLAVGDGKIPSRNQLKAELKIGAPKANAILAELRASGFDPTDPPADAARLHLVTDPEPAPPVPEKKSAPKAPVAPGPSAATPVPVDADVTPAAAPVPEGPARRPVAVWPVLLLAAPAFVAIWSGWVGLGGLTGFGVVHPLPGIWDSFTLNTAITLPVGMETYAAYAIHVWLSGRVPGRARRFAKRSAIGSLALGALGQVAYHLMAAAHMSAAPWQITTLVACLPVAVLGMGAALAHLIRDTNDGEVN